METWTKQSGFPVVMVKRNTPTEYLLTQKRFFSNPANEGVSTSPSEFKWVALTFFLYPKKSMLEIIKFSLFLCRPVINGWFRWRTWPIQIQPCKLKYSRFQICKVMRHLHSLRHHVMYLWFPFSCAVPVTVPIETKWIKFNKDQVGYYRVNYELSEWKLLSEALYNKSNDFSTADRAHLLNDAFSLAEATQLDYEVALNLTRYLANETENVPWSVAATKLSGIRKLMSQTENYSKFLVSWNANAPYKNCIAYKFALNSIAAIWP